MQLYYSVIRYFPDTFSDEGFAIGLIFTDDKGMQIKYNISDDKIRRINSVFGIKKSKLIESYLKFLGTSILTKKRLDYLSVYENGSLRFTPPKIVALGSNSFDKLFDDYFDQFILAKKTKSEKTQDYSTSRIRNKFKSRLKANADIDKRLNLDYDLRNSSLSNYFISKSKIDFIGINGKIFAGELIDLNNSEDTVGNKLTQTIATFKAFEETFPENFDPEECKILLLQDQFENKKEYVAKLEAWSKSAGYSLFIRPSLEQFAHSIEDIVKRKNIGRFDQWINHHK